MTNLEQLLADDKRGATAIFKDALELLLVQDNAVTIKENVEKLYTQFPVMGLFVKLWYEFREMQSNTEIHYFLKKPAANWIYRFRVSCKQPASNYTMIVLF